MSKVLILGEGYVGTELLTELTLSDHSVFSVSRSTLDYHNQSILRKFLINNDFVYVVNCSGFTGSPNVDECETRREECWNLNVKVPLNINKSCASLGIQYIHISSGCIYDGYEKQYTEYDKPNFGLFNKASFYSMTKHAYEHHAEGGAIIRIRMPFSNSLHARSYLTKIYNYSNLINMVNSKTYISDLTSFIKYIINNHIPANEIGKLNFVNPWPLDTQDVCKLLTNAGLNNKNWKFVDLDELNLAAPRSNCVLSTEKLQSLFPDFKMHTEREAITAALSNISIK